MIPNTQAKNKNKNERNWIASKLKTFIAQDTVKNVKRQTQNERKYLQIL